MTDGIARLIVDSAGNPVGVVANGSIYRIQTQNRQYDSESQAHQDISPFGQAHVAQIHRLIGANLYADKPISHDEWYISKVHGGTVVNLAGLVYLDTGSEANGGAGLVSKHRAIFVSGTNNRYLVGMKVGDAGVANNVRHWGALSDAEQNGFLFELDGTTFRVVVINSGVRTEIDSGSFNGNHGASFVLDTNFHVYAIDYSAGSVRFYIDNQLLHKYTATNGATADVLDMALHSHIQNNNDLAESHQLIIRGQSISRIGPTNTVRLEQELSEEYVSQVVRSIIAGRSGDGTYKNVQLDWNNRLKTVSALDPSAKELSEQMLYELRRIRTLMEILTDEKIRETELED